MKATYDQQGRAAFLPAFECLVALLEQGRYDLGGLNTILGCLTNLSVETEVENMIMGNENVTSLLESAMRSNIQDVDVQDHCNKIINNLASSPAACRKQEHCFASVIQASLQEHVGERYMVVQILALVEAFASATFHTHMQPLILRARAAHPQDGQVQRSIIAASKATQPEDGDAVRKRRRIELCEKLKEATETANAVFEDLEDALQRNADHPTGIALLESLTVSTLEDDQLLPALTVLEAHSANIRTRLGDLVQSLCFICSDADVNAALVPCGHRMCLGCAKKLTVCGFCRTEITSRLELH